MIVKNEENNIEACLNSVLGIADEIIIVDTGSSDETVNLCRKYTQKIYYYEWQNDFAAARNKAFSYATGDYILWLDADDIIAEKDRENFLKLKQDIDFDIDVVMMRYNTTFDEDGKVVFSFYRERLLKRARNFLWVEPVHEYIQISGKIINSEIAVTHTKKQKEKSRRNIEIYEKNLKNRKNLSPRGMYYYARELREHGNYKKAENWLKRFLKSKKGWIEDNISACEELAICLELQGKRDKILPALFKSFEFDTPRAEICCRIGYFYKKAGDFARAIYWFSSVFMLIRPEGSWGFIREDCWGYIPALECAVCCDKIGLIEEAEQWNEKAATIKLTAAVLHNREYFSKIRERQ